MVGLPPWKIGQETRGQRERGGGGAGGGWVKKKRENVGPAGRPRSGYFIREGWEATFSPSPSVSYTTFPFSLMQTDYVISRFIQVATRFARLFSFFPPFLSPPPSPSPPPSSSISFSSSDRNAASFCFGKLIQPDSPAAFNQRRFTIFSLRLLSVNFILPLLPQLLYPCASVVRYARILLCSFRVRFIAASWSFEGGREGGRGGEGRGKRRFNEGWDCCWCSSWGTIYFNDMCVCVFLWWLIGEKGNWKYRALRWRNVTVFAFFFFFEFVEIDRRAAYMRTMILRGIVFRICKINSTAQRGEKREEEVAWQRVSLIAI